MTYDEFVAVITSGSPSLEDYKCVVLYVESASIETLWSALNTGGVHKFFIAVINKVLQNKIVQANFDNATSNVTRKLTSPKPGK